MCEQITKWTSAGAEIMSADLGVVAPIRHFREYIRHTLIGAVKSAVVIHYQSKLYF